MTTNMQEMFEALVLNDIPLPQDIKVNKYITNHIDQLTKKELDDITSVFRSMETGLRVATIYPKVKDHIEVILITLFEQGPSPSPENAWPQPHRPGGGGHAQLHSQGWLDLLP